MTRSPCPCESVTESCSLAILGGHDRTEERGSGPGEGDSEPVGDCGAKIRESLSSPDAHTRDAATEREHGHTLARVVGRGRGRVVAVIGGDEEQVVLPKGGQKGW